VRPPLGVAPPGKPAASGAPQAEGKPSFTNEPAALECESRILLQLELSRPRLASIRSTGDLARLPRALLRQAHASCTCNATGTPPDWHPAPSHRVKYIGLRRSRDVSVCRARRDLGSARPPLTTAPSAALLLFHIGAPPRRHLHQQGGIVTDMVGKYDPNERDPSMTMLRIATRDWDTAKLEAGCKLLNEGIGLNKAARQVGICPSATPCCGP
jgi:hypothetical protein